MCLRFLRRWTAALLWSAALATSTACAQGPVGWLRYAIPPDPPRYHSLPHAVVLLGNNAGQAAPEELTAADELDRGLGHMVAGTDVVLHRFDPRIDAIVLGTTEALHRARIGRSLPGWTEKPLPEEGFRIVHLRRGVREWYILQGGSPRAELWAAFRFAALVAEDQQLPEDFTDMPYLPLRALDMGRAADLLPLLEGAAPLANGATATSAWPRAGLPRLLASVGINGLVLEGSMEEAARAAATILPFGMRVWLRPSEAEPTALEAAARFTASVPNLGGLVLRVPAHATVRQLQAMLRVANAQARLLRYSGASVVIEDALGPPLREALEALTGEPDTSPEERAAVLRGLLEPNVILGGAAMPVPMMGLGSANFGLLPGISQQATFEVMPRRFDMLAYPAAAWAGALQTPERGMHGDTTLGALLAGAGDANLHGGVVGRLSADNASHMLQQPLLQASLYAFGRVAWSPMLKVEAVTDEWSRQTWGNDARAHTVATRILLASTAAAMNNSTPLGLPLLTTETGGPDPARTARLSLSGIPLASTLSIGIDRAAGGTNEIARYPDEFARQLSTVAQCPEEWLLLLHRLPYRATLPSGKTVVQTFYDAHFAGAAAAGNAEDAWESTQGLVDESRYNTVHAFLARAATHAEIWRETTTEWMQRTSGVRDALGFVGSHTGRVEAEAMQLTGYSVQTIGPESASGSKRIVCGVGECTAAMKFTGDENVYRVEVGYLDEHVGSSFELLVNGEVRARWQNSISPAAAEAERFIVNGVRLRTGDGLAVHAMAPGRAGAPLDFVEITRDPRWN